MQAWYFLFALFALQAYGHSMMTCAVLDSNNNCVGAVRESFSSLQQTNYAYDGTNACQSPGRGVSNIANKYSNSSPMGKLRSGQTFTIQWKARNHAVANQSPRVVKMYLSPAIQRGQTDDYSFNTFKSNMFCTGPFTNCGKGADVDTPGDDIPCTLTCTVPTLATGNYTMLWHWDWRQNDGKEYMTCADLQITASGNAPSQNPVETSAQQTSAASSAQRSSSSAQRSSASSSAQRSSAQQQQSSAQQQTSAASSAQDIPTSQASSASKGIVGTTTSSGCPDLVQQCKDTCGDNAITTCSCVSGQFVAICEDTQSSSSLLTISAILVFVIALF